MACQSRPSTASCCAAVSPNPAQYAASSARNCSRFAANRRLMNSLFIGSARRAARPSKIGVPGTSISPIALHVLLLVLVENFPQLPRMRARRRPPAPAAADHLAVVLAERDPQLARVLHP